MLDFSFTGWGKGLRARHLGYNAFIMAQPVLSQEWQLTIADLKLYIGI